MIPHRNEHFGETYLDMQTFQQSQHTQCYSQGGSTGVPAVNKLNIVRLQCFDDVGWAAGRASGQ